MPISKIDATAIDSTAHLWDKSSNNISYTTGSVGIGTASPGSGVRLDVLGGEIKAGRVDSSSEGGQVSFGRASDNNTAWYLDVYGNTSTPTLRFVDVSSAAVRVEIDGSGRVTKPYQPYCLVGRNGGNVNAQTAPIPWNQVVYNIGGHFNASTYRFTAPIAGYYYASINVMAVGTNPIEVAIRINGSTAINTRNGGGASNYNSTSATHVLYLAANDYIDAKVEGGYTMSGGDGYAYSGMCCYLLG
jgi:hypothetical protein